MEQEHQARGNLIIVQQHIQISPEFGLPQVPQILQYSPDLVSLLNVLKNMRITQMATVTDLSSIVEDEVGNLKYVVGWQFGEDRALPLLVSHLFQPLHLQAELD